MRLILCRELVRAIHVHVPVQFTMLLLEAMLVWAVDALVHNFLLKTILLVSHDDNDVNAHPVTLWCVVSLVHCITYWPSVWNYSTISGPFRHTDSIEARTIAHWLKYSEGMRQHWHTNSVIDRHSSTLATIQLFWNQWITGWYFLIW